MYGIVKQQTKLLKELKKNTTRGQSNQFFKISWVLPENSMNSKTSLIFKFFALGDTCQ